LLGASVALGRARSAAAAGRPEAELVGRLDELVGHLDTALSELRSLARGIHPAILTGQGLGGALVSLAEGAGVAAEVSCTSERFSTLVESTAYFVVAEALANATKYAPSSTVRISAERLGNSLVLDVSDDGDGGADPRRGSGLIGLSDRIAALGGNLVVTSPPGDGTRIRAELPTDPEPAGHPRF
ncbi:MAG: sensor histidine kinase, partial [Acidimicrobiia bacterium]